MFQKRGMLVAVFVIFAAACLFVGCCKCEQVVEVKEAATQELMIGIGRDFYHGPESSNFVHGSAGVWESLTYLNKSLEPEMQLAEKITSDETKKVWTVTLRQGIKFHDGSTLNADAVIKSAMRLKENLKFDEYGTFLDIEKIEAVGDNEVKFIYKHPEPAFPAKVAYHGCPIFSLNSFDDEGKLIHPYGTGPFKFEEYKKGDALILTRNDDYWRTKPKLTKVTFKVVPNPATRLAALKTGEIHAIADVGGVLPEQVPDIKRDHNLLLHSQAVTTSHYIIFNNKKPPFNDPKLRLAVSMSIDRPQLVEKVLSGYGDPASSIFTPLAKSWVVVDLWGSDRTKAKELAGQALLEKPEKVSLVINSALANRWPYKLIAEIMQSELKTLGLDVEIKMVEAGAWSQALMSGDYHMSLSPYTLMTGDPDFYFGRWIYSKGQMNTARGLGYEKFEADKLVLDAAREGDTAKRKALYRNLQELVARDVPVAPIFNDVSLYAVRKEVKDLRLDPFFKPTLEKAWLSE
ncbi:MAG: ABC transporter substrate-binding protein [Fastidiosipilaceae bacterium]